MIGIIAGHGFFGGHLNKLNQNFSPFCNLCKEEFETSYHLDEMSVKKRHTVKYKVIYHLG